MVKTATAMRFRMTALGAAFVCAGVAAPARADHPAGGAGEHDAATMANISYNFARFMNWRGARKDGARDVFRLCVISETFDEGWLAVEGKSVSGRSVEVVHFPVLGDAARDCNLAYIEAPLAKAAVLRDVSEAGVVTMSDRVDFLRIGGAIQLFFVANRFEFDVNDQTLRRSGVRLSSKLRRVGMKVEMSSR